MGMFDKGKQGVTWDYLRERHPEILSELKTLRDWDTVKAVVPEAEKLGDYSLFSLQALASFIKEFHIERGLLGERIESLSQKLEDTRTEMRERDSALEKRINVLEKGLSDVQRKTLLIEGISNLLPRINELEEKLEMNQAEILARFEKSYLRLIEEKVEELVDRRIRELEGSILGFSGDLAKSLKELQERHERLIIENYELKREVERLRGALKRKEGELAELKKKLSSYAELNRRIEELQKRVQEYEKKTGRLSKAERELLRLTGAGSLEEALEAVRRMKEEYVPKSKVAPLLSELKRLQERLDELERENAALREKNEKLSQALKMLLEREESEES
ncbi:hypothetical protein [Thermococcus sp. AM4]|uniref:hypothetical protein n=1 Tax=Thermococcus sp. (strain AM4) TaxID=246969 RepID=UPI0001871277|nr:hypothetical protein [Thermococcus sp. AM4]EEB74329.1 conserved hypothetical protein [Thermococcus sp. AM4]